LVSAPEIATVPVGVVPAPVTVTATATDWPGVEASGLSDVIAVVLVLEETGVTVWPALPELLELLESPLYMAVKVLKPVVVKTTLQLPAPPESVKLQLLSAPPIDTVPVGVAPLPFTTTLTVTA
jgi:hypothetical protein